MLTTLLIAAVLSAEPEQPQATPAQLRDAIEAAEARRDKLIASISRDLREAGRVTDARDKAKRREAAEFLKRLKKRDDAPYIPITHVSDSLPPGTVGTLSYGYRVFQRLSDTEALVELLNTHGEPLVYIRDRDFSTQADGEMYSTQDVFVVVGTYNYTTANGTSKTVKLLEPFREQVAYERAFAAWLAER